MQHVRSHQAAAVEEIVRALKGPRVLTLDRLAERLGAERWPEGMFRRAVDRAVEDGRVVRLTDRLVELAESEKVFFGS